MFKRILIASAVAAAFAVPAMAEISISGSAEMDLMLGTNRAKGTTGEDGTQLYEEIAITLNVDGRDKLDNGDTLKWRLAQKVATDWKYDSFGQREAWIGYEGAWGDLRFGNQFTDTYLTLDWPYGVNGSGNLMADSGSFATWTGAKDQGMGGSIRYASPTMSGVNFTAQYILGSYANDGSLADGWDATVNGNWGGLYLNAGYQLLNNRAFVSDAFMDNPVDVFNTKGSGNETQLWYVGGRYVSGPWNVRAMYKNNMVKYNGGADKDEAGQWLVGAGYSWGKNALNLSYQEIMDGERTHNGSTETVNSGVQQVAAQWNYSLSKNSIAFVQGRYQMYDSQASKRFDGASASADNSFRLTVGTWTSF